MAREPSVVGAVARLGAAVALGLAARDRLADADEQARKLIARSRNGTLDRSMPIVTDLGSTYAIGGAAAVLWVAGRKKIARDLLGAGLLAWTAAQALKPLYGRARPYDVDDVEIMVRKPAGLSYPSGHPAVAAAVAAAVGSDVRGPARSLVQRAPRVVAFSRVYTGVHYPTDVIGGVLLGRAIGDLWRRFARR